MADPAQAKQNSAQADLFAAPSAMPDGFRYQPELIDEAEQQRLLAAMARLDFKPFEFHGFAGKREVISFGWRYNFDGSGLHKAGEIPDFLLPLREAAARFGGLPPDALRHALLTTYPPGAAIGWHKDRPAFGDVIGISLLSPCTFRFRRKSGASLQRASWQRGSWQRRSFTAAPRSAYLLRGPSRTEWEHSIPAVDARRYSITFRTLRDDKPA
jgi:alkylated DNA repair dioxygenase AlkB